MRAPNVVKVPPILGKLASFWHNGDGSSEVRQPPDPTGSVRLHKDCTRFGLALSHFILTCSRISFTPMKICQRLNCRTPTPFCSIHQQHEQLVLADGHDMALHSPLAAVLKTCNHTPSDSCAHTASVCFSHSQWKHSRHSGNSTTIWRPCNHS